MLSWVSSGSRQKKLSPLTDPDQEYLQTWVGKISYYFSILQVLNFYLTYFFTPGVSGGDLLVLRDLHFRNFGLS